MPSKIKDTMVRQTRSMSSGGSGIRSHPRASAMAAERRDSSIRLRSGSAGHNPLRDEESSDHEPIEVCESKCRSCSTQFIFLHWNDIPLS